MKPGLARRVPAGIAAQEAEDAGCRGARPVGMVRALVLEVQGWPQNLQDRPGADRESSA